MSVAVICARGSYLNLFQDLSTALSHVINLFRILLWLSLSDVLPKPKRPRNKFGVTYYFNYRHFVKQNVSTESLRFRVTLRYCADAEEILKQAFEARPARPGLRGPTFKLPANVTILKL